MQGIRAKNYLTRVYFCQAFDMGLYFSFLSRVLPRLIAQCDSTLNWTSALFCIRAIGGLVGAYLAGFIDKLDAHNMLFATQVPSFQTLLLPVYLQLACF